MSKRKALKAEGQPYVPEKDPRGFFWWPVKFITPNKKQPRKYFADESMAGLKDSISRLGILNPLTIKPWDDSGQATLVDGERRFRCAQQLGMETVPVFLAAKEDQDIFRTSVVLNFCREDMTEIEIAHALQYLMEKHCYSQAEVANLIGKSQAWVSQKLKYLRLCPEVASLLAVRKIAPSIALAVAVYPLESQEKLVKMLQDEVRSKGTPLTPQEASMLVRKHGENFEVKPDRTKTGRKYLPFATRVVLSLTKRSAKLNKDFDSLLQDVPVKELETVGGGNLIALEREVKEMQKSAGKILEKLRIVL